ncbi:MAG TPA: bifunctional oligoribonuclease/PAP phosphatase NrnA [Gemmatimonadaceae bacterium]|nr:bifunctional oligoribonuclease/PAP phosphatase NrnA [Gemmatimonadaceae bacterium]
MPTTPLHSPLHIPAARRAALERVARELTGGRTAVLSTHINADGDGCGSEAALALLLAQRGIGARIVNPTPWPATFAFLLEGIHDDSAKGARALQGADLAIVLDISDVKRLGTLADAVRGFRGTKLVIDHHVPAAEPPGEIIVADTAACATGELVFDLARVMELEITPEVARALYTAMLTDTGGFRFSNTSPRCHAVAAQLLAAGVDPEEMYRRIYAQVSVGRLKLLRDALDSLEVDAAHGLAWISLPAGVLEKYDVRGEELDGFSEHARSVSGTRMALFFRDLGHGQVKVSFRSTAGVDVNAFARQFGGGGHARASGAMIQGGLLEVKDKVVAAAREFVGDGKGRG